MTEKQIEVVTEWFNSGVVVLAEEMDVDEQSILTLIENITIPDFYDDLQHADN